MNSTNMPYPHIVRNAQILGGKPIISGTRVSVEFLLQSLASGMSIGDILQQYPQLTEGLIREAFAFAATEIERTEVEELKFG